MKMRVFWVPQIPCPPFLVGVESLEEGVKLLKVLGDYDQFLFEKKIRPYYSNAGVIQVFDETDDFDGPGGSWSDWCDDETGEDDTVKFLADRKTEVVENQNAFSAAARLHAASSQQILEANGDLNMPYFSDLAIVASAWLAEHAQEINK